MLRRSSRRSSQPRARAAQLFHAQLGCESLEARCYLSLIHERLPVLPDVGAPREIFVSGLYRGPATLLDDLNGDGIREILAGNTSTLFENRQGAAVLSGSNGERLRVYDATIDSVALGARVANVGDLDDDGAADYAISGIDGERAISIFSGMSGERLRALVGESFAAAGDVDGDGVDDLLVGDAQLNRVRIYAGATTTVIREISGADLDVDGFGLLLAGGADLDGDSVPDFVSGLLTLVTSEPRSYRPTLHAISGATGQLLWTVDGLGIASEDASTGIIFDHRVTPDLTGDDVADVAFTLGSRVVILDGANGTFAVDSTVESGLALARSLAVISDADGDGRPDIVVGVPDSLALDQGGARIISSSDGRVIGSIRRGPTATTFDPFPVTLAAGDLDGDGLADLIAASRTGQLLVYSGDNLLAPEVHGATSGGFSRSIIWGSAAGRAFVLRDSIPTFLPDLPQFAAGERIIDVFESQDRFYVLAAPADGALPFVWSADLDLGADSVERAELAGFTLIGVPPGTISDLRGIALGSGVALVQQLVNGQETAWLADLEDATITYLYRGIPLDLAVAPGESGVVSIGLSIDDPAAGILWRDNQTAPLDFRPVAISDSGGFIVGTRSEQIVVLDLTGASPTETVIPLIADGTDMVPAGINSRGDVVGLYTSIYRPQQRSAFFSAASGIAMDVSSLVPYQEFLASANIDRIVAITDNGDILLQRSGEYSLLTTVEVTSGPFRAGDREISVAFAPDGSVFVGTINRAGEVLAFTRAGSTGTRTDFATDLGLRPLEPSSIVTWIENDGTARLAVATYGGLVLLTQAADGSWSMRNLTSEIAGSSAIVSGLTTLVPPNGLRLIAGLNSFSRLVIYGQTLETTPNGDGAWAFQNLTETVAQSPFLPSFSGELISYVTPWGAVNIAGLTDAGEPVVFWSAPAITGWRITNLAQQATGNAHGLVNLRVAQTPWNGINLYAEQSGFFLPGHNAVVAIWWVPEFGDVWRADVIAEADLERSWPSGTLTAYGTPWGGLNFARVDPDGKIEVYWWSPESNVWQRQVLNDEVVGSGAAAARAFTAEGPLASAVADDRFVIIARGPVGDLFQFSWQLGGSWEFNGL